MPELTAPYVRESNCTVLVRDRESAMHRKEGELREKLGPSEAAGLGEVHWLTWLGQPQSVMFDHGGLFQCGRRTYLFGQWKCIAAEGKDTVREMLDEVEEAQDVRDYGHGVVASDCAVIEAGAAEPTKSGAEDSVRSLTRAQVLSALRISGVTAPPTGDFVHVRK